MRQEEFESDLYRQVTSEALTLRFSSEQLRALKVPLPILQRLFQVGLIDLRTKLKIAVSFQEALVNSLDHGNLELLSEWKDSIEADGRDTYTRIRGERLLDPNYNHRQVEIRVEYTPEAIRLFLRDEGPGFLPETAVPRSQLPRLLSVYGRGIAVIVGNMDEVVYTDHGREIHMVKYLQTPGAESLRSTAESQPKDGAR